MAELPLKGKPVLCLLLEEKVSHGDGRGDCESNKTKFSNFY